MLGEGDEGGCWGARERVVGKKLSKEVVKQRGGWRVNPGSKPPLYVLLSHGISLTKHKGKITLKFKMVATEY